MCISNNVPYAATVGLEVEKHGRNLAGNAVRFALMGEAGVGWGQKSTTSACRSRL